MLYARDYLRCQTCFDVTYVAVEESFDSYLGIVACLRQAFGMSTWVTIWIHVIARVDAYS